jgi:hypothetical protein
MIVSLLRTLAGASSDPIASDRDSHSLIRTHSLRQTAARFAGKCSERLHRAMSWTNDRARRLRSIDLSAFSDDQLRDIGILDGQSPRRRSERAE